MDQNWIIALKEKISQVLVGPLVNGILSIQRHLLKPFDELVEIHARP